MADLSEPAGRLEAVTPDDNNNLPNVARSLYVWQLGGYPAHFEHASRSPSMTYGKL